MQTYVFKTYFIDTGGNPIGASRYNALVDLETRAQISARLIDGAGFSDHNPVTGEPNGLFVWDVNGLGIVSSAMKDEAGTPVPTAPEGPGYLRLPATGGTYTVALTVVPFKLAPRPVPPVPRGPLTLPTPVNYRSTLPWTPPDSRDFLRADFWGVEMPGAPVVPGVGQRPDRIMSWFLPKYPRAFQEAYLAQYAGLGYRHFLLSLDDALGPVDNGPRTPGAGISFAQFKQTCALVKTYVRYLHVRFCSKDFSPQNMRLADYQARYGPYLAELLADRLIDEGSPAWEMNLHFQPGADTISIAKWFGDQCQSKGISAWLHFSPEYTSWFADGDPRGRVGFWSDLEHLINGLDYQSRGPAWSAGMCQARAVDTLWQFGEIFHDQYKFRWEEDLADWMWNQDTETTVVDDQGAPQVVDVTPEAANARGYLACCTVDNVRGSDAKVWGFGNGGRLPDGTPL